MITIMENEEPMIKTITMKIKPSTHLKPVGWIKKNNKKNKKRIVSERWNLSEEYLTFEKQLEMIHAIQDNNFNFFDDASKILIREIERKIYGYKQQDLEKNHYQVEDFIFLKDIIEKMIACEMKCYYCFEPMFLLYEKVRESKQWSVDRLDNDQGHNQHNFVLACLECNLKRRRRTADKFLFTKQLTIVKTDPNNNDHVGKISL
jgi:hypothetical protein